MTNRFVLSKYCDILSRENRNILNFCSMLVSYILCFFFHVTSAKVEPNRFSTKAADKSRLLCCLIIDKLKQKCNNFIKENSVSVFCFEQISIYETNEEVDNNLKSVCIVT